MATKKPISKKTTAKKSPAKTAAKRTSKKKQSVESFKVYKETEPFMSFKASKQSLYWVVIGLISIAFAWYTYAITESINDIYSQIDMIRLTDIEEPAVKLEAK